MIDKRFWIIVAEKWSKEEDGISPIPPLVLDPIELDDNPITNEEIDDILADLGLDF